MTKNNPNKVLVFFPTYNAEKTIHNVLLSIPPAISHLDYEILIIDDCSQDKTFKTARIYKEEFKHLNLNILRNTESQGYGGNQKIGLHYAIKYNFDILVVFPPDGKYSLEHIETLINMFEDSNVDMLLGSRITSALQAFKNGMPVLRFLGVKVLTGIQNLLLKTRFSDLHSCYRAYRLKAFKKIPYQLNTNDYHFDTEIFIQFLLKKLYIKETPIPVTYDTAISSERSVRYAWNVFLATLTSIFQKTSLFYERKYDVEEGSSKYTLKIGFTSSHQFAIENVPPESKVLDIGCGDSLVGEELRKKNCHLDSIDAEDPKDVEKIKNFTKMNLNTPDLPIEVERFDYILLLDVLEHLEEPEQFIYHLRAKANGRTPQFIISVPNIGFFTMRLQLLMGRFSYGVRGILDLGHRRLFTFKTILRLLDQAGYKIIKHKGLPAPFPLAFGLNPFSKFLLLLNEFSIRILPKLFSYQIILIASPFPTPEALLKSTVQNSPNYKSEKTQDTLDSI
jgi:glycosyltransferase involved in cell wall biosynthesis